ncbi:MAG TPA: hypothetical protein VK390_10455 [Propionibacteriaceae bacterium]|nr:hypothetical protein [Propionibacteriaceae bacterium]
MPDVSDPGAGARRHPQKRYLVPDLAGLTQSPGLTAQRRVGWRFIAFYTSAQMGTSLVFLAPLLVTLALKVNSLVGIERAPASLGLVTGVASCWRSSAIRSSAS